jgi:hypothetical protein
MEPKENRLLVKCWVSGLVSFRMSHRERRRARKLVRMGYLTFARVGRNRRYILTKKGEDQVPKELKQDTPRIRVYR